MTDTAPKSDVMDSVLSEPIISSDKLVDFRKANIDYESRIVELRETVRQLRHSMKALESERDQYRREARKYKAELSQMKEPPLVIGNVEQIIETDKVIVRSTAGPQFLSHVSEGVKIEEVIVGAQCALHPQSYVLVEILPRKVDAQISAMEVDVAPNVRYRDIGGLEHQKELLRETIELPLLKPDLFKETGIEPPKGVLLYGPPGTGKTLLAKAAAHETQASFIRMVGSELVQKYIGEGARLVRELFALARKKAPAIIFIDEIDAIGSMRTAESYSAGDHEVGRTLMQLLAELDGFDSRGNVKIIAATNRIDIMDQALLRPGRFDRIIEFPLPDLTARKNILQIYTENMHLEKSISLKKLAEETDGFNGAELKALTVEAGMTAIRYGRATIKSKDISEALKVVRNGRIKTETRELPIGMYL